MKTERIIRLLVEATAEIAITLLIKAIVKNEQESIR